MKFVISFLFSVSSFASPINVLHENMGEDARIYKTILENDYSIPSELIQVEQIRKCEEVKKKGKLDLCLKNNGDLLVVSVNREFINDSLKVFQNP